MPRILFTMASCRSAGALAVVPDSCFCKCEPYLPSCGLCCTPGLGFSQHNIWLSVAFLLQATTSLMSCSNECAGIFR